MTTAFVHDPDKDIALVKDGVVVQVARAPCDPADFGPEPDGDLVDFAPGEAIPGMLWDGTTLTAPEPPPPPPEPRRLIRKSLIQERVNTLGKLGDAFAALQAQPLYFGRWFAPDYPSVYFDDPDMLTMFAGIGLTSEQIATVTAA